MGNSKAKKALTVTAAVVLCGVLAALVIVDFVKAPLKQTDKLSVAMGTVITQKLYDKNDASDKCEEIQKIIEGLEKKISWRIEGSAVFELNENSSLSCDDEMKDILKLSCDVYEASHGAFDITVGTLTSLWRIGEEDAYLPKSEEIKKALSFVDGSLVRLDGDTAYIGEGQLVDLGAVGKGLACDKIRAYLDTVNIPCAVVSVGGSVLLYGENDKRTVAVRDPRGSADEYMATLLLSDCCVSTSGDYERVLEKNGERYHHILDTKTGYPAESGVISVTVVCHSGFLSDALSTACFILGVDEGKKLLEKYDAQGVFVTDDLKVCVTDGLRESFTLTSDKYVLCGETK